jgi:hypothetical protein
LSIQDSELKGPAPRLETNNSLAKLGLRAADRLLHSSRFARAKCLVRVKSVSLILAHPDARGCGKITRRAEFRLTCRANQRYQFAPSFPGKRGVSRSSRTREGMRWTRQRRRAGYSQGESLVSDRPARRTNGAKSAFAKASADGYQARRNLWCWQLRTAKACGSGTRCWCQVGGDVCRPDRAWQNRQFADDGDKTNSSPGRARHKP